MLDGINLFLESLIKPCEYEVYKSPSDLLWEKTYDAFYYSQAEVNGFHLVHSLSTDVLKEDNADEEMTSADFISIDFLDSMIKDLHLTEIRVTKKH